MPGSGVPMESVLRVRDVLLATEDTVCLQRAELVTEAWRRHEAEPPPLRRALAFAHVLRHMELDLSSNPFFAGNTSSHPRAWMLVPEHGFTTDAQVVLENPRLAAILHGAVPDELTEYWRDRSFGGACGIGHLAVDLGAVVHRGLDAIAEELETDARDGSEEQRTYRRAMVLALRAVVEWAERYAASAEALERSETDPQLRAAYARVARACRHVPARPARSLFEGLQAIVLVHLAIAIEGHGMSVSVGSPDRVLARFVDGSAEEDDAAGLLAAFMLKIAANSIFGRGYKSLTITVGGADHEGRDCSNALTMGFLEAAERLRIGDPPLFLRWHPVLDQRVKRRAAAMLSSGLSMPLLVNDLPTAAGLQSAGIAREDAWDYCVVGCNELAIPGRLMESATALNGTVQYLELLLRALKAPGQPPADMSGLLDRLETVMLDHALRMREHGERHRMRMAREVPTPFTSALMRECGRRGEDLLTGMPYRLPGVYERGLTNAANALAAIEEVVFRSPQLSLVELGEVLDSNFATPGVRELLRSAPKWGNDDERVDRWAVELVAMRERVLDQVDSRFGGTCHTCSHVVRSLHHLDGQCLPASPDGRPTGAPLADSIGAEAGTARQGPTGVLNSVLKLDAARHYRGGYNLNLTLPSAAADPSVLLPLVETFFGAGGQELQVNVLDAATLRSAREHPERYGDLLVRVAGLSARFIDLPPVEQDELIARAEAAAGDCAQGPEAAAPS